MTSLYFPLIYTAPLERPQRNFEPLRKLEKQLRKVLLSTKNFDKTDAERHAAKYMEGMTRFPNIDRYDMRLLSQIIYYTVKYNLVSQEDVLENILHPSNDQISYMMSKISNEKWSMRHGPNAIHGEAKKIFESRFIQMWIRYLKTYAVYVLSRNVRQTVELDEVDEESKTTKKTYEEESEEEWQDEFDGDDAYYGEYY